MTDNNTLLYRQHYAGNLEYRFTTANGLQPEAAYFGDGRVAFIENSRRYEYYLKDHLGNIRLTFTDKNNNGVVDVNNTANNEILQENHYYPFGMDQSGPWMNDAALDNAYKYNGIERNTDFGLNLDLAFFRSYDASLARWWQVDPKPNVSTSGYSGLNNNPILYFDYLGDTTRVFTTRGRYIGTINDSRANQEHFISLNSKGIKEQRRLINKANKSTSAADNAASIVRGGSKYFIGSNTRSDLSAISSKSANENKERLFALTYSSDNKELRATDLSSKVSDRVSDRINSKEARNALSDFASLNPSLSTIGWGHTHPHVQIPGDQNFNLSALHEPSYPGDYGNLGIVNPIEGGLGNNPSILASRYGYSIYTSANNVNDANSYEGGPSPAIYRFSGTTLSKLSNE